MEGADYGSGGGAHAASQGGFAPPRPWAASEAQQGAAMASLGPGPGATNANAAPVAAMPPATVQLVHVRCEACKSLLEVGVPMTQLLVGDPVVVRCGSCTTLLRVAIRGGGPPQNDSAAFLRHMAAQQQAAVAQQQAAVAQQMRMMAAGYYGGGMGMAGGSLSAAQQMMSQAHVPSLPVTGAPAMAAHTPPRPKVPRAPTKYNEHMRDELKRLKSSTPGIEHKEAWRLASGSWKKNNQNPRMEGDEDKPASDEGGGGGEQGEGPFEEEPLPAPPAPPSSPAEAAPPAAQVAPPAAQVDVSEAAWEQPLCAAAALPPPPPTPDEEAPSPGHAPPPTPHAPVVVGAKRKEAECEGDAA